ncbi:Hypothetical predicted protein [Octopus vulgaris]|uniref:Uncharacterized protein n=1 Tax=Octopus vulgaris TaxID=6645 RepID=A0AA36BDK8_OCTVU|nr:Hypothetical predicted protein [Octopus vulgaris]
MWSLNLLEIAVKYPTNQQKQQQQQQQHQQHQQSVQHHFQLIVNIFVKFLLLTSIFYFCHEILLCYYCYSPKYYVPTLLFPSPPSSLPAILCEQATMWSYQTARNSSNVSLEITLYLIKKK